MILDALKPSIRTLRHLLDHPQTIQMGEKLAYGSYFVGAGVLLAKDVYQAQTSESRKKTVIRDGIVLASTIAGTLLAARFLKESHPDVHQQLSQSLKFLLVSIQKRYPNTGLESLLQKDLEHTPLFKEFRQVLGNMYRHTKEKYVQLLKEPAMREDFFKELKAEVQGNPSLAFYLMKSLPKQSLEGHLSLKALFQLTAEEQLSKLKQNPGLAQELITLLERDPQKSEKLPKLLWERFQTDIQHLFPVEAEEHDHADIKQVVSFFKTGSISVLSGMFGGLLAHRLVGDPKEKKADILKEASFQIIANIALCAVGAWAGFKAFEKMHFKSNLARFLLVTTGLSVGIGGGGMVANTFGKYFINPIADWWSGKNHSLAHLKEHFEGEWHKVDGKRHIEWQDLILHLDDIPLALVMSGVKLLEPFVPPFFAFSGYRAGIGYRNEQPLSQGLESNVMQSRHKNPCHLLPRDSVFQTFYLQQ